MIRISRIICLIIAVTCVNIITVELYRRNAVIITVIA